MTTQTIIGIVAILAAIVFRITIVQEVIEHKEQKLYKGYQVVWDFSQYYIMWNEVYYMDFRNNKISKNRPTEGYCERNEALNALDKFLGRNGRKSI